jgi:hypothetical protein
MPTITKETGAIVAGANSYLDIAEADVYADEHPYPGTWSAKTDAEKAALLIHASRLIDGRCEFKGKLRDIEQPMKWPRNDVIQEDTEYFDEFPNNAVPGDVKMAAAFLALAMTEANRAGDTPGEGLSSLSLGKGAIQLQFDKSSKAPILPNDAIVKLQRWCINDLTTNVAQGSKSNVARISRA